MAKEMLDNWRIVEIQVKKYTELEVENDIKSRLTNNSETSTNYFGCSLFESFKSCLKSI